MKLHKLILIFMLLGSVAMLGCGSDSTPWQPEPPIVDVPVDPDDETPDVIIPPVNAPDEDEDTDIAPDDELADKYLTEV